MKSFEERIEIGQTGLTSCRIGLGSTFNAPTYAIESAFDRGVNYLYWGTVRQPDFAAAMRNIEKSRRDEAIFTIQSYSQDPSTIEAEVAEATKAAGVKDFDFLLLGNRSEIPDSAFREVFERMRDKGMVRFLSLSSHNRPLIPELVSKYGSEESPYELLMFRYNAVHRGAEKDVFPHIADGPRPTFATYTSTRWGHLLDPSKMPPGEKPLTGGECYRFALSHDSVDMLICGPGSADQLEEAIAALAAGPINDDERERIERIGAFLYGKYAPAYPDQGDATDVAAGKAAG